MTPPPADLDAIVDELAPRSRRERIEALRRLVPSLSLSQRFTLLHRLDIYLDHDIRLPATTEPLRRLLPGLIEEFEVESILDLPCGDFHWMRHVDLRDVAYIGADIVPELVGQAEDRYGRTGREFRVLDGTRDPLPQVDLVFCRDLVIHLSLADIRRLLDNFVRSGSRLLLVNHFADHPSNPDIDSGDFRPINLCWPPFEIPEPIRVLPDWSPAQTDHFRDRVMALWRLDDIRRAGFGGD